MLRNSCVVLLVGLLTFLSPVLASGGTLGMGPGAEWAVPMSDRELQGIRGGFFGLAFSLVFEGFIDAQSSVAGAVAKAPGGEPVPVPSLDFNVTDGQNSARTVVGNFNGASGIFQVNQVPGSFSVVHNNLFIQITLVTVQNSAALPAVFSNLLQPLR